MLTQCELWTEPEATVAKGLRPVFELIETYAKESHWWRYLLKCRECGQLYVFDFYEEIDWEGGQDPQFTTWVPVSGDLEIENVLRSAPGQLTAFVPRLCKDWPKGEPKAKLYWVIEAAEDGAQRPAAALKVFGPRSSGDDSAE